MEFYVYRYIRLDTNTPCYVGKGKHRRASKISSHNQYCKRIHSKYGIKIEYIKTNLTESEALNKESQLIILYKSLGYCEANMCLGGRGNSGYKHSKKWKLENSNRMLGNDHGKYYTKPVINCRGEIFNSQIEATKAYNLKSQSSIRQNLTGKAKSAGKYEDGSKIKWRLL